MAQATISARIDSADKSKFDDFCSEVGLSSSAAINLFVKAVLRERRIPFPVTTDKFYSESNMAFMKKGIEALNTGKGITHELIEEDTE